eukprot:scaffold168104_cov28-Tisochrysis_lutea.AAC.4
MATRNGGLFGCSGQGPGSAFWWWHEPGLACTWMAGLPARGRFGGASPIIWICCLLYSNFWA